MSNHTAAFIGEITVAEVKRLNDAVSGSLFFSASSAMVEALAGICVVSVSESAVVMPRMQR